MTETHEQPRPPDGPPGAPTGATAGGPRVDPRQQFHRLDALRRSSSDRYVAGVCGGLGRHFDVDPTLIRVLFAVTTLFAGAGVLLYLAVWLLVPEDRSARAAINLRPDVTRVLLVVAAVIGVLTLTGTAWGGFHRGWVLAVVAVVAVAVLVGRERRTPGAGPRSGFPPYYPPTSPAAGPVGGPPVDQPAPASYAAAWAPDPAPWQPPGPPVATRPRRPRRTGVVLFWPTLALLAIGLGILGLVDRGQQVPAAGYPALALAIIGAMLVVGAFRGRPGGLVLIGLVTAVVLAGTTVTGGFRSSRTVDVTPTTAAAVAPSYRIDNGRIFLDLREVADPAALAGRTLDLGVNAGEITVVVPRSIRVEAHATLRYAGQIDLGDSSNGALGGVSQSRTLGDPTGRAPLVLDLHGRVGQITVEEQ